MSKWRDANRGVLAESIASALNAQAPIDQIEALIGKTRGGNEITFVYTKPNGDIQTRHVTIESVSGDSIRALDHKNGNVKSFRVDRITNARKI